MEEVRQANPLKRPLLSLAISQAASCVAVFVAAYLRRLGVVETNEEHAGRYLLLAFVVVPSVAAAVSLLALKNAPIKTWSIGLILLGALAMSGALAVGESPVNYGLPVALLAMNILFVAAFHLAGLAIAKIRRTPGA